MTSVDHRQIDYKGKKYGYFVINGEWTGDIRSETNPDKTPYLTRGSKTHTAITELIKKELSK